MRERREEGTGDQEREGPRSSAGTKRIAGRENKKEKQAETKRERERERDAELKKTGERESFSKIDSGSLL